MCLPHRGSSRISVKPNGTELCAVQLCRLSMMANRQRVFLMGHTLCAIVPTEHCGFGPSSQLSTMGRCATSTNFPSPKQRAVQSRATSVLPIFGRYGRSLSVACRLSSELGLAILVHCIQLFFFGNNVSLMHSNNMTICMLISIICSPWTNIMVS